MSKQKNGFMPPVFAVTFQDAFQRLGVDTAKFKKMYANGVGDADGGKAYEVTPMFAVGVIDGESEPGKKCKIAAKDFVYAAYSGNVREVLPQEAIDAYEEDLKSYASYKEEMGDKGFVAGPTEGILDDKGNHVSSEGAAVFKEGDEPPPSESGDDAGGSKKPRRTGRKGGKKGGDAGDSEGG